MASLAFVNGKPTIVSNNGKDTLKTALSLEDGQIAKRNRLAQDDQQTQNFEYLKALIAKSRNKDIHNLVGNLPLAECPRVWIVGGGPSLRGFDFNQLDGEVVFAVNRSFEHVPNPSCVVSMDSRFIMWATEGNLGQKAANIWRNLKCPKICAFLKNSPGTYDHEQPVYVVERDPNGKPSMGRPSMDKLHDCNNSGLAAIQLAWAMGAKVINLLGFDMGVSALEDDEIETVGGRERQAWFHDGYPSKQSTDVYSKMSRGFKPFAEAMEADKVKVTLFGESTLKCFDKKDLAEAEELLAKKVARPTVVGYYTENTAYAEEAKAMEETAVFFGLETDIIPMCNYGSWQANTLAKSYFLKTMLDRRNAPILYLDADARVRKYPRFFDDFGKDFAYCTFDWPKVKGSKRKDKETSSAVLYLAPTEEVKTLLTVWTDACERCLQDDTGDNDQQVLEAAIESMPELKKNTAEVPMSYNQIFDSMAGLGEPVIEQMQASRRLKEAVSC